MSALVAWSILLLQIPWGIDWDNFIYAVGEIGTYDNSLFQNNVFLSEGVISPRYIIEHLFALLMKINGGNWSNVAILWIFFGTIVQSLPIANIVSRLHVSQQPVYAAVFT